MSHLVGVKEAEAVRAATESTVVEVDVACRVVVFDQTRLGHFVVATAFG